MYRGVQIGTILVFNSHTGGIPPGFRPGGRTSFLKIQRNVKLNGGGGC